MALVRDKTKPGKPPVKIADNIAEDWVKRFPNQYELVEPLADEPIKLAIKEKPTVKAVPKKKGAVVGAKKKKK